jgi:hemerythrin-like metal-binding protein
MAASGELPEGLYEALPYLYAAVGVATIVVLHNAMAIFSGLTLLSAGGMVWIMRRKSRRAAQDAVLGAFDTPAGPRLIQLSWSPSLESGHQAIDEQHRRLFGIGNELINTAAANRSKQEIETLLDELIDHIADHFCTEEALLARTRNPMSAEHQKIHRTLLARAHDLRDGYIEGRVVAADLVGFIVYDVINMHVLKEDLKLREW